MAQSAYERGLEHQNDFQHMKIESRILKNYLEKHEQQNQKEEKFKNGNKLERKDKKERRQAEAMTERAQWLEWRQEAKEAEDDNREDQDSEEEKEEEKQSQPGGGLLWDQNLRGGVLTPQEPTEEIPEKEDLPPDLGQEEGELNSFCLNCAHSPCICLLLKLDLKLKLLRKEEQAKEDWQMKKEERAVAVENQEDLPQKTKVRLVPLKEVVKNQSAITPCGTVKTNLIETKLNIEPEDPLEADLKPKLEKPQYPQLHPIPASSNRRLETPATLTTNPTTPTNQLEHLSHRNRGGGQPQSGTIKAKRRKKYFRTEMRGGANPKQKQSRTNQHKDRTPFAHNCRTNQQQTRNQQQQHLCTNQQRGGGN